MMLIRIPPEQIMQYWPQIKECVASSLPAHVLENDDNLLAIQEQLLILVLECWIGKDNDHIYLVMTTRITVEEITRVKNLLIFTLTVVDDYPDKMWSDNLAVLKTYARSRGCTNIIAYSENKEIIQIAKTLGANISTRLLFFPL